MAGREMGPISDRTRTTLWVSPDLLEAVKRTAEKLGVSQTAVFALGTANFVVQIAPLLGPGPKRREVLKKMQTMTEDVISRASAGL